MTSAKTTTVGALFVAFVTLATLAKADTESLETEASLKLQCNTAENRATMGPFADPNEKAAVQTIDWREMADCTFSNGTTIRVKVAADEAGRDGCTLWFSLWVNRAKVLSRRPYWRCLPITIRVTISAKDIEVCEAPDTADADDSSSTSPPQEQPPPPSVQCRHAQLPIRGVASDVEEYPPPGAPLRLPARSLALKENKDDRICKAMKLVEVEGLHEQQLEPPEGAEEINWHPLPPGEFAGDNSWAEFDFDNDGVTDRVWRREDWSHMGEGTYFALTHKGKQVSPSWFDHPSGEGGLFYSGERSPYATRYVHWTVFRYGRRTYLIGEPVNPAIAPAITVVTPDAGDLRLICAFNRVPENY